MAVGQLALFALSTVLVALAVFVWRARPENDVNRWFAAQTILLASWILGIGGLQSGLQLDAWGRFTFASASLIPAAFLAFSKYYPTTTPWPSAPALKATLVLGGLFAVLSLTTPLIVYDNYLTPEGLRRTPGALYHAFSIYFLLAWTASLGVFIRKWWGARGLERAQLQYLGAGIIISAVGGIGTNLLLPIITGRSTYSWVGPYFSFMFVALVAHSVIRHRLMDLRVVINRGIVLGVAIASLSTAAIFARRAIAPTWTSEALRFPADVLIVIVVVLGMLTSPAQQLLSRFIDPYLYRGRIEYSSALHEATHRLSHLMQPVDLANEIRKILTDAFVPEWFAMAARPGDDGELDVLTPQITTDRQLLALAADVAGHNRPGVILIGPTVTPEIANCFAQFKDAQVEIIIALARRGHLLGVVLLGPRRSGDAYFARDLAFMESLAELASIALENALLYRQRIQMLEYSERLLESLESAVVAVDVSGRLTSLNPAASRLLGVANADKGRSLELLPSEIAWALALTITANWRPRDVEVSIDHRLRGEVPVVVSTAVLHDSPGTITGALAVVTDLSTVKALERNQRRIEHLALMARFYAGIAHEIRSPLTAISNFIAMLPDRFDDPEYRDTATRLLPMEVGRIVRLADRLRLMAPSEDGKLASVSLHPLLADIVAIHTPAAEESRVRLVLDCEDELPPVLGDPSQLVQLFVNLLRNGIEAMPQGGRLEIKCSAPAGHDYVAIDIIDEGAGIEPSVRARVFDPFFTTKPYGTGLGLAICREIADFHRARLDLQARRFGKGTIARVEFPRLASDARELLTDHADPDRISTSRQLPA
jgi:PAS domain S-box-containing protein